MVEITVTALRLYNINNVAIDNAALQTFKLYIRNNMYKLVFIHELPLPVLYSSF